MDKIEEIKKEFFDKFVVQIDSKGRELKKLNYNAWLLPFKAEELWQFIESKLKEVQEEARKVDENTSDGYHTFKELYRYRMLYNAAFFNMLPKRKYKVIKSKKHSDGALCFGGGWFIVMAELPTGQISNHYELKNWDLFKVPEKEWAYTWDLHTANDAASRIEKYLDSSD